MLNKKLNHEYKCEVCGKPATINIQNQWHTYVIDKEGNFQETDTYEGDENHFYCDKCEAKER